LALDLETVRAHVGDEPSDGDLQLLLEAALEAIEARYGPANATKREYLRAFGPWVKLGLRAEAVLDVTEGTTVLTEADYELWDGGMYLHRLGETQPRSWSTWVDVTYVPLSEDAQRDAIALALIDSGTVNPEGLASITVGPWSESYQKQTPEEMQSQRQAILGSLRPPRTGVW
jgi:hypothetical protein